MSMNREPAREERQLGEKNHPGTSGEIASNSSTPSTIPGVRKALRQSLQQSLVPQSLITDMLKRFFLEETHYEEVVLEEPREKEFTEGSTTASFRVSNGFRYALVRQTPVLGAALTHPGYDAKGRPHAENEDAFFLSSTRAVVCDGLGGAGGGAAASAMMTDMFAECISESVDEVIVKVHEKLHGIAATFLESVWKPSTTIVLADIADHVLTLRWAGDSRALLFSSQGMLKFVTRDDSAIMKHTADASVQENLNHPRRHLLDNAVGAVAETYVLHEAVVPLVSGDLLLLVSDGVTDNMNSEMLSRFMQHCIKTKVSLHEIPLKLLAFLLGAQRKNIRPHTESDPKPAKRDAVTILLQKIV